MVRLSLEELKARHLRLERSVAELLALRIEAAKAQRKLRHSRAHQRPAGHKAGGRSPSMRRGSRTRSTPQS